jgi:hypothetical protein
MEIHQTHLLQHWPKENNITIPGGMLPRNDYFVSLFSGPYIQYYLLYGIFPLCFDPDTGHDYRLYEAIMAEAIHFQLHKVLVWLTQGLYRKSVDMSIDMEDRNDRYGREETITIARFCVGRPGWIVETDTIQVPVWRETTKKVGIMMVGAEIGGKLAPRPMLLG